MTDTSSDLLNELPTSSEEFEAKLQEFRDGNWAALSPEKKAFAYAYIENYDHRDAASQIGLSPDMGIRLRRDPFVTAFINDLQSILGERSLITRDFVNMQWLKLLPKVTGEEAVMLGVSKEGLQLEGYEFNAAAAVKILTELSKSVDFYKPIVDDNVAPVVFQVVDARKRDDEDDAT